MFRLSNRFMLIKIIFSLFLIVSLSIFMPVISCQPLQSIDSGFLREKKNSGNLLSLNYDSVFLENNPVSQGLFDWLIILLNFLISVLEKIADLITNTIKLIDLVERAIQVISILINAINQLINTILDLFTPDYLH